jgi:hypothetical protein
MQTNSTTAMFANSVAVTPFWPFVGKIDNPLLGAVCVKSGDFTDGAELSVTMYSNPHNYLVSKPYSSTTWGNQATNAIAMRFE